MHELSLVQAMLRQVEGLARDHHATRVMAIRIGVGAFSGVVPELFASAYELVADDSIARGARLDVASIPLVIRCDACQQESSLNRFSFQCPHCDSDSVAIIRGEELVLESVTFEAAEEART